MIPELANAILESEEEIRELMNAVPAGHEVIRGFQTLQEFFAIPIQIP